MKESHEVNVCFKPLEELSADEKKDCDNVLMNCKEGTIYNDIDIISSSLTFFPECDGFVLFFKFEQSIIAYFPFVKTISNSNHFYYSPYQKTLIPYGGMIVHDNFKNREQEIIKLTLKTLSEIFYKIYVKTNPGIEAELYINNNFKVSTIPTLIIDINKHENDLWASFTNRIRRNIKKAENSGLEIKIVIPSIPTDVEHLSLIYKELCERKKLLYHSEAYYFDLLNLMNLKYGSRVFYAIKNGKIISAMSVCLFKKTINPWFGGTLNEFVKTEAGSLVYWEILKFGINNEYTTFDFLGLDIGPIAFYKKGFGGVEVPVCHIYRASMLYKIKNRLNKWGILKVQ